MTGKKYDDEKPKFDLIPARPHLELAHVVTGGGKRYGFNNWKELEHWRERYIAACFRHINAWQLGEKLDLDSGLHHLAHACACLYFIMDKEL